MKNIELVEKIQKVLDDKLAQDIVVLNLEGISSLADYFIIATSNSQRHSISLSENVDFELLKENITPKSVEGTMSGDWIIMDYIDIIVHIFTKEYREFYDIEKLWADAPEYDVISKKLVELKDVKEGY